MSPNCPDISVAGNSIVGSTFTQQPGDGPYTGWVTAVSASNGVRLWRFSAPDQLLGTAVAQGTVYVAGRSAVYALNGTSGNQIWNSVLGFPLGTVLVEGPWVYAGYHGAAYALNPSSGAVVQQRLFCAFGATTVFACTGTQLAALASSTWATDWTYTASAAIWKVVVGGSQLYLITKDGRLVALDGSTGQFSWQGQTLLYNLELIASQGEVVGVSPLRQGAANGTIDAFDGATVTQRWAHQLPTTAQDDGVLTIVGG
jgi:outer membrane protein assembly factor BamB